MLHFFRTHQKYFFAIITIVIVISFSFFGTYGTLETSGYRDQIAFTAIDGTQIKRSELDELVAFIASDSDDKLLIGGNWGPNFLNDGVLYKDFLQTGLAAILAEQYKDIIYQDYISRQEKEKKHRFYQHPQADFINQESAWSYFAPAMQSQVNSVISASNPLDKDAFEARIQLYLTERRIPPSTIKQILRFQEKQNNWVTPDPQLQYIDLSLFGYHTFEDWFGPRFTRLIAEFIINASKVAEQKGYRVSKEEALADLMRNSEISYRQNSKNSNIAVANSAEYFQEQLRRLNMDSNLAARTWKQVMLFRELFQDAGNAIFVDPFSFEKVNAFMNGTANGELYQLSPEFRFGNGEDLRKFEAYITSVAKKEDKNQLTPPKNYLTVAEVKKIAPELIQKKYTVEVGHVDSKQFEGKISLRETWNWEADESHWTSLKEKFPELALKAAKTREERVKAIDALDDTTRAQVDLFAREQMIAEHPEWIDQALEKTDRKTQQLIIRQKGGKAPLFGVKDPLQLSQKLDSADIGKEFIYSPDQKRHYTIRVVERTPEWEVSTFADAVRGGVLEDLSKRIVTDDQLKATVASLKKEIEAAGLLKNGQVFTNDIAASYRFYPYVKTAQESLKKDKKNSSSYVRENHETKSLKNQFYLEKSDYPISRHDAEERFETEEIFALGVGEWTPIVTPSNGDLYFYQLTAKFLNTDEGVDGKIEQVRKLLSNSVQRAIMDRLVAEFKEANALSLNYLDTGPEMAPYEPGNSLEGSQDG